ncbi:MAG TPA: hypothetical protein VHK63_02005 [Candidatus Limnocylindria bacterium]|nr:hypothetical protein [Candidatus Limnocylindria bacterium]
MDVEAVREHAQEHCDALLAGDVGRAAESMSPELQSNLGPVVAMLPLPLTAATIESVEMAGTAYRAVLHLVGEDGSVRLETRWKERNGRPTIVEASHLSNAPSATPEADAEVDAAR